MADGADAEARLGLTLDVMDDVYLDMGNRSDWSPSDDLPAQSLPQWLYFFLGLTHHHFFFLPSFFLPCPLSFPPLPPFFETHSFRESRSPRVFT